ncbi:MAG TPA: cupin domain-containing protein [Acetobacteraceae bacterium]|nr:cupin domain-containing protein [Acetobacteraceae bacterium]
MSQPPATLAELIAPLTLAEFSEILRRRELTYRQGTNAQRYAPLIGWQAVRRLLAEGKHPTYRDAVRVTKESAYVPPGKWMDDGKIDVAKLDAYLAGGYSVVLNRIEPFVPPLAGVCEDIMTRLSEGSFIGVVVTSGAGDGAFLTHFDPEDLIILQIEGTKRWQVFGPPVAYPLRGMAKRTLENSELLFDEVLEPGDLLFVPGGYWHHCQSGLSTSVHIGVFMIAPTKWHAIDAMIRPLMEDEMFRLPLSRLETEDRLASAEAELKRFLIDKVESLNLKEFVAGWPKIAR